MYILSLPTSGDVAQRATEVTEEERETPATEISDSDEDEGEENEPEPESESKLELESTDEDEPLESHLLQLLQESGWSENLRNLCQERLRDPTANIGNYEELRNSVDTQAKEMVPEAVKAEMVKKIAVLLRGMCEE
ncbi:Similar to Enhancer of yellow 2 transcription factor; acc. no. B0WG73 [Pyronema omphalodes CBS 100304]|uniref:Similar to Enhancer of yellow 2 transcription factor acc. no. B0WG73 n=1 Tax=Pyronema omphalodes (strain CBS 100304) TaxID=1076935 RepID=U4LGZ4_PYROM|nr:Similar to Enhancer of yellow 2 transcription factor; acc. no. B0WG73 [Pyronema omphalodes CBS 100304]